MYELSEEDRLLAQQIAKSRQPQEPRGAGGIGGFALDILPFGRQAEKLLTGRAGEITPGEVAGEALLSAIPFGLGKAAKVGKGLFKGGRGAARGVDEAVESQYGAAKDLLAGGRPTTPLARTAERLQNVQTGFRPGAKVGGKELSAKRSKELNEHVRNIGAKPTDAADTIFRRNEEFLRAQERTIDNVLDVNNKALKKTDANEILSSVKRPLGVDAETNILYKDLGDRVRSTSDLKGLQQLRREVDEIINFNRASVSPDPAAERVAKTFRDAISKKVGKEVPDLKPLNQAYSKAKDVETFIAGQAAGGGRGLSAGGSVLGLPRVGARPIQGAAGVAARGAEALSGMGARVAGAVPEGARRVAKPLLQQAAVRGGADILGLRSEYAGSGAPTALPADQALAAGVPGGAPGELPTDTSQTGIPSQEVFQREAANAMMAGDYETAEQILSFSGAFGPAEEKPLSAEASKVIANANSGLTSLGQIASIIQQGGGEVPKGTLVPGRELFGGLGANVLGTASFDTAADNLKDVITRMRTGAALTASEEKFYSKQIPTAFDSPEVINQKLQMFQDLFTSVANRTGVAGTDAAAMFGAATP